MRGVSTIAKRSVSAHGVPQPYGSGAFDDALPAGFAVWAGGGRTFGAVPVDADEAEGGAAGLGPGAAVGGVVAADAAGGGAAESVRASAEVEVEVVGDVEDADDDVVTGETRPELEAP